MSYISLSQHLIDSPNLKPEEPVNEMLMTLIAASVLAWTCKPLLDTPFAKSIGEGIGAMFAGIGSVFGLINKVGGKKGNDETKSGNKDEDNPTPKQKPSPETKPQKDGNKDEDNPTPKQKPSPETIQSVCSIIAAKKLSDEVDKAQDAYDKDKTDANKKKLEEAKNNHSTFLTSAFDKDGNPRPAKEVVDNLTKAYGLKSPEELAKKLGTDKITAGDFEKNAKSACGDWVDADGNIDEEKVKAEREKLGKAAKEAHAANAEQNRKDNEAATKAERDKNREIDKKNEKPKDDHDKNTDSKKADRLKQIEDRWTKASEEVEELEKKLKDASDDEKKDIEAQLDKKKKLVANLEKAQKKLDDNAEKEYVVHHDGKETTIIKRPKKRGEGSTWCYKNDPATTISPDQARAMLKASGVKEGLTLAEWLALFLD